MCPSLPTRLTPKRFGGITRLFGNRAVTSFQPVGETRTDGERTDSDAAPERDFLDGAAGGNGGGDGCGGFDTGLDFGFGFGGVGAFHGRILLFWILERFWK